MRITKLFNRFTLTVGSLVLVSLIMGVILTVLIQQITLRVSLTENEEGLTRTPAVAALPEVVTPKVKKHKEQPSPTYYYGFGGYPLHKEDKQ